MRVDDTTDVRSCFSHTPTGALLAVTSMLTSSVDGNTQLKTIKALGVDSPGKDVAVGQAQQRLAEGEDSSPPIQIAGFRVLSYTPAKATIEVVCSTEGPEEQALFTTSGELVWDENDWHFVFRDNGDGGPVSGAVSSLAGYVKWSASNG